MEQYTRDGHKFCEEGNVKNWDHYECAYWIGNVLGFEYVMKSVFDKKITGSMLLDMDAQMMKSLGMKPIHIVTVSRRVANLKKMLHDKERPVLSVELADGITLTSETQLLEEKHRV